MKIAILILALLIVACVEKEDGYKFKGRSFVFDDEILYTVYGQDSNGEWIMVGLQFYGGQQDIYHGLKVSACTKYGCDEEIFYKSEEK